MKKILSLILILIMVLVLAGCNATPAEDGGFGGTSGVREDMGNEAPVPGGADMPEVSDHIQGDEIESTQQAQEDENNINVQAKIVDQSENSYFIIGLDDNLQGLINVQIEDTYIPNLVRVGDVISFDFNGMIAESYPAQIGNISNIQLVEEKGDTIGVYREALLALRGTDSGLDKNASEIVLDLTEVNNLSIVEKEALTYLFSCDIEKFGSVYQSSMAELKENGKITDNDGFLSFPDGVVYRISNVEEPNGFTFDIKKWASSLGAYGFSDCKVTSKNNSYTWEKGDEWIS